MWKAKVQPRFGRSGTFYATPSVAYGRVYIGGTDGKVYSFGAASGKLRWSQSTLPPIVSGHELSIVPTQP